jgi:hypothetical protein
LAKSDAPVADVLPAEARRILTATCRISQHVEGKAGLRSEIARSRRGSKCGDRLRAGFAELVWISP